MKIKIFAIVLLLTVFPCFLNVVYASWSYYAYTYTPNYEDHIDVDVKNIKINDLDLNSTYKITFKYSADITYDINHESGSVSASWNHPSGWVKIFSHTGREENGKAQTSGSFSIIASTENSHSISLTISLWVVADGGASNSYDSAEISVHASLSLYSIEKIEDDDGGDNDGGGGGGNDRKYSRLDVKTYNQYGNVIYHIPINVSGFESGTYKTPFYIDKASNTNSSFTVILSAPLKYVTPSTVRYFINWSLMKSLYSDVLIAWSTNNTFKVYIPNNTWRLARAYYSRKYYWYRIRVNSSIPVFINYESDIGNGINHTPFTLYKESAEDYGFQAVLQAPSEVFYNGTYWIFKFWKYKIPEDKIAWSKSRENPKKFRCPNAAKNTATVYAVYERYARIIVESDPVKHVPIAVKYLNYSFINYTDFSIEKIREGALVTLEAPKILTANGERYYFSHWSVNGETRYNLSINFKAIGLIRVIVFYSTEDSDSEYKIIDLGGEWLLPGETINITLPLTGNYTFTVKPLYKIKTNLTALIISPDMKNFEYINLNNLSLRVEKPYVPNIGTCLVLPSNITDYPLVISERFHGWYFIGASAWPPLSVTKPSCFKEVFCESNWTTYAVYNFSIIWRNSTVNASNSTEKGIIWKKTIVVTSINFTVEGFFENDRLYVIWKVSYRFLPPPELGIPLDLPHQDIWLTLEKDNEILFSQRLGMGTRFYGISDSNKTVICDLYISLSDLVERFNYKQAILVGRVRWSGPLNTPTNTVPFSEEKKVPLVFVGMQLLEYDPSPLHLLLKWTLLNNTPLSDYVQYCSCIRINVLTEWDGKFYTDVGVKSKLDPTIYKVDLEIDSSWPRKITVFFTQRITKNILLIVPPIRV